MVNEVILAKLQGFLLGMLIIVFGNTTTTTHPKAGGRIFIGVTRSQVKHVELHVRVKHEHLSHTGVWGPLCGCL